MDTPQMNADDSRKKQQDAEPRDDKAVAQMDDFDIEVRELQRPVRPRGVLAE